MSKYLIECRYQPACNLALNKFPERLGQCDQGCGNPAIGELSLQFGAVGAPDQITQRCTSHMLEIIESYDDLSLAIQSKGYSGHLKLGIPWRWHRSEKGDDQDDSLFLNTSFVLRGETAKRVSECFPDVERIISTQKPKKFKDETGRLFTEHFVTVEPTDDSTRYSVLEALRAVADNDQRAKRLLSIVAVSELVTLILKVPLEPIPE